MRKFFKDHVVAKGTKDYTHQDLKGGLYKFPKDKLDELYTYLCESKSSLCEKLTPIIKFYIDIDEYTENIEIKTFTESLKNTILELINGPEDFTYHILKNQGKLKYHIYFPDLLCDKKLALKLVKIINKKLDKKYLDENAYNSCFRMYKVLKFNRKKKCYEPNSNYDFLEPVELSELEKFKLVSIQTEETESNFEIKSELLEQIEQYEKKDKENKRKLRESDLVDLDEYIENYEDYERDNYIYENVLKVKNFEYIRYLLFECLSRERVNEYSEWTKLVMILTNLKVPLDIIVSWSRISDKYDDQSIDLIKELMKKSKEQGYTFYSQYKALLNLAKQDSIKKFNEYVIGLSKFEKNVLGTNKIKGHLFNDERGMCEMFAELFKKRIISYGPEDDLNFLYWNGDIWKVDQNQKIQYYFQLYISQNLDFYIDVLNKDLKKHPDPETQEHQEIQMELKNARQMRKNVNRSKFVKACFKNTIGSNLLNNDKFKETINSNPDVIAVKNGNIDLRTGKLIPRKYNDYNTFTLEMEYDENLSTKNMEKFMSDIMLGDKEITEFLSTFIGYCITGHNKEQKFSVWYGDKGSNGKSVLAKLLDRTFGDYFTILDSEIFSNRKANAGTATTHLNYIQDKRFGIMDESNKNEEFNEGLIKRITGGTKLRIRKLHKESELIDVAIKPIILTNFKPKFTNDDALFRRMILITFNALFLDDQTKIKYDKNNPRHKWRDPDIEEKITDEEVLAYFVKFAKKWYDNGQKLKIPEKVKKYNESFQKSCNTINSFLEHECIVEIPQNNAKVFPSITTLYNAFCDYCRDNELNKLPKNEFIDHLKTYGYEVKQTEFNEECFEILLKND